MNTNMCEKKLKLAVDLGSTTVDLCLLGNDNEIVSASFFPNKQSLYGRDVINRINCANNIITHNGEQMKAFLAMKKIFIGDLCNTLGSMLQNIKCDYADIEKICICGNTTMISILLELDMEKMGYFPFDTTLKESISTNTRDVFGNDFPVACELLLSGCASAFIGGDILSGIYYIESDYNIKGNYLLIDLGTNGEMVLRNNGKYFGTSTACGPAFEGCVRKQSVYGSTLLDSICIGVKTKNISKEGIIREPFFEKGLDISGVHIDMEIIHNIILAKAAIATGISLLVRCSGVSIDDINNVFIAGGFGLHIDIDSAIYLGLFPEWFSNRVTICGNSSLKGACRILADREDIRKIDNNNIDIIQMTMLDGYQDELIKHMSFSRMEI